eukprot:8900329-Prorocentrum_lima.AAC.1
MAAAHLLPDTAACALHRLLLLLASNPPCSALLQGGRGRGPAVQAPQAAMSARHAACVAAA